MCVCASMQKCDFECISTPGNVCHDACVSLGVWVCVCAVEG